MFVVPMFLRFRSGRLRAAAAVMAACAVLTGTGCSSRGATAVPPARQAASGTNSSGVAPFDAQTVEAATRRMAALAPGTTMTGNVTAGPGVTCQNAIFAIVCYGPPGSTASLDVEVPLGSFEFPPTRCSGGSWTDYTIAEHTASSARAPQSARRKQSTSCGTATHTLTVTAPATPYSYDFKGAYATFTACWDYLPNPCATMTSGIARLGIVTEPANTGGGPTPTPTAAPPGGGGGGGGTTCGSSTARLPASLRMPRTGVIGGGGSPPPTVAPTVAPTVTPTAAPTETPSPTPTATPQPCVSESPTPDLELSMDGSLITPQYATNAPSYNYDDAAVVALEQADNGGIGTAASARRTSGRIVLLCPGATTIGAAEQATMTVHVEVKCQPPAIVTKIDARLRRLGFNHQTTAVVQPVTRSQACGTSSCSADFSFSTNATGLYEASATDTVTSGQETKTSKRFLRIVPFNDRGDAYPQYADTRFPALLVPFPSAQRTQFHKCPPNLKTDQFGCYARRTDFSDNLKQQYLLAGWDRSIFKYPDIDAHHIHPLQWGGDNSVLDNGVFLIRYVHHSEFDPWWNAITVPD